MEPDAKTLTGAGLLVILVLREVFRFLKEREPRKPNGHEKAHMEIMTLLHQIDATGQAMQKDTEHIRATTHRLLNEMGAAKTATDLMIRLLERQ